MFFRKIIYLIILLVIHLKSYATFNVNFYYNYNLELEPFNTKIHKRELQPAVDKGSFSFVGFEKVESVPVSFPSDICVLRVEDGSKYAAALHMGKSGVRHFVVLKMKNGSYEQIAAIPKPNAIAMDCEQFANKGYVAIVSNLTKPVQYAEDASAMIYEIAGDHIRPVQYFTTPDLLSSYLYASDNDLLLLQIVSNGKSKHNFSCPYFKWSGGSFSELGTIACTNARHLEPFSMNNERYVAVANYDDAHGRTDTNSEIYKFSQGTQQFELFQKIKTKGAVDVQHFKVSSHRQEIDQHFLIYGNTKRTFSKNKEAEEKYLETNSVIYIFYNDTFVPYQELSLYAVKKFVPLELFENGKCILLVACGDDDIKFYNLEDGKFEESNIHFTGDAFSQGVVNMRVYRENQKNYLIIANELMMENEANTFVPVLKQDERMHTLKQRIISWTEEESKRLQNVDVGDLSMRVQKKFDLLEQSDYKLKRDISTSYITTVTTESLVYPKMKMSTNYWKALYYINQALDILEDEISQKQRSKRQTNNEDQHENLEYIYDSLNIKTLTIDQNLKAKRVNQIDTENPEFKEIHAPKIVVKGKYTKPTRDRAYYQENLDYLQDNEILQIRNLQINGKLNEYTWNELLNNTLKRKAEIQFMKAPIKIRNLETPRMVVTNNIVDGQHLGTLIPIDGGEYVINQDIQFAAPVSAKSVEIHERLNNVHVFKGKFDVLLKRSNETQIIEGAKNLNNVKVMEPITIAGQMLGKQLESITPNKAIHEALILQGDFMINGDVDINHKLKTADMIDLREKLSVKQTLDRGIRMDKPLDGVKVKFQHPLKVNNSLVSFVNQNDLQRLVKLNQDEIQIVEGEKTFTDSLEIRRGFSEVKNLNGVDMEMLEKNSFLKNTNQTIKVPMKFGKIQAKSVNSSSILLNNLNISDYLTKAENQTVKGNLIVDNLRTNTLKVENLNTNNRIFQQNIQDIYRQKSRNAPQQDVFVKNQKFHGSIYVQNLVLNTTINGRKVEEIEKNLLQLEGNIKYVGNFKFNYPMNVTQLTFYGKLNDVHAQDLGRCWLQKTGTQQQEFVGSQTLASLNAENEIHFQGKLNGFTMNDFYSKTYWTSRDEYLNEVVFENPIEISSSLTTQTLNYHYIPEEVLCHNESQQIFHSLTIEGDLEVQGSGSLNVTLMKNINVNALRDYLQGDYSDQLCVENAYFNQGPPSYKTLNYRSISQILDTVWLANENVILPQNVEITDAYFEGLLEFEGPMNNMNLEFLKENYFSKTKSQNVSVKVEFSGGVVCEDNIEANNIWIFGPIVEGKSGTSFDFVQFVGNTLKTSGPHTISGNWSILEAIIDGNLNQVLVNNLNLADDIIHNVKNLQPYELRAPKKFKDISIEDLLATDHSCLLNNVPVANWIKDAVYLYENYTIFGTTTMTSINVFNDLIVMGKLNNISFNEYSLLLQDREQTLPGKLRIISHLMDEKRFLTNNIENLYTDFINSEYIPRSMDNLMVFAMHVEIPSHVIFKEPLKVEKYQGPEGLLTQTRWLKRALQQRSVLADAATQNTDLESMHDFAEIEDYLRNITKDTFYAVDHFEIRQILLLNSSKILSFCFKSPTGVVEDVLAIMENVTNDVTFYKWLPESKQFIENQDFNWLPDNIAVLNIVQKLSKESHAPLEIEYLKEFISKLNDMPPITSSNLELEFLNESCLIVYTSAVNSPVFQISCMDINNQQLKSERMARTSSNIQQILSLNQNSLALITNSSLEIWNITSRELKISQKFPVNNPKQLAVANVQESRYMAVIAKDSHTSINYGSIEIYRSFNDSYFELCQILPCPHAIKIEYSYIPQSEDLLLYVLTDLLVKPLIVYQYQGLLGFQEILTESILPAHGLDVKDLPMKSSPHHMVGVVGKDELTIVEIVIRKM